MTTIPFTKTDVDRVADLLDSEAWYAFGLDFDDRAAAVDMLHHWTEGGRPASTVSPLRFRGVYGTAALRDILFDNILDQEDDDFPEVVGDVYATGNGIEVVTPDGRWILAEEQALKLNAALGSMLAFTLNQPWSADDPSTILSRGRRQVAEEG